MLLNFEYPLDVDKILRKKKAIKRQLLLNDKLVEKNIAILGGSTTSEIKNILEIFLLNYGVKPNFYESDYNKYYEDSLFGNNELDNFIFNINYEDLVEHPKNNVRKILNFCELEFEESCFEHHTNKSPIRTMSAHQARNKIYKSSINSCKNFEIYLETLFNILDKKKAP